jgi:hypothetical protein
MAHSRIHQFATIPADFGDYIIDPNFHDHWLVGSAAGYVSGDAGREADIEWLRLRGMRESVSDAWATAGSQASVSCPRSAGWQARMARLRQGSRSQPIV